MGNAERKEIRDLYDKAYLGGADGRVETFARAIIAAHTAKLLAGVELPESNGYRIGTDGECEGVFTSKERQAYAAAAAAQARVKALDEAKRVCLELAELNRGGSTESMWEWEECAAAIEKLKVPK